MLWSSRKKKVCHDDVIKWKHFPRNWSFVRGIHRSPVNSPHKGQWLGAFMFSLICVWINDSVNNRDAGDLRRYRAHYDVIVMSWLHPAGFCVFLSNNWFDSQKTTPTEKHYVDIPIYPWNRAYHYWWTERNYMMTIIKIIIVWHWGFCKSILLIMYLSIEYHTLFSSVPLFCFFF